MATLPYAASILLDSLAGYLMVISLISGFPIVEKFVKTTSGIPTSSALGDASLKFLKFDIRLFKPVECLFLYLISYPITAAYRASSGSMPGCLSLVVVLIGLLVYIDSSAVAKQGPIADDETKSDTGSFIFQNEKEKPSLSVKTAVSSPSYTRTSSQSSGGGAARSNVVPEPAVSTPTMTNVKSSAKKKRHSETESKEEGPFSFRKLQSAGQVNHGQRSFDGFDVLDPIMSAEEGAEEDDVPSIVTWDPAVQRTVTTDDMLQKRNAHRREQSLIEGDLIDSNLEPHYTNLIDSANAPIFGVDSEGRVNVWNKCAMRIVGYTPDEVMGKNLVQEFITQDYQASVGTVIERALRGDETANYEFPLMTKEGARIEILIRSLVLLVLVKISQRDTEMKQRAAEAATAAQATISAHVYHEIRNVVGSVLALADRAMEAVDLALIEDDDELGLKELPTRVQELTDHQRLVCQHAVDTLNDMLDVAKMENGTYTPKHEVIDLGDLCRKAAALQSPRMRATVNLELNVPSPDSLFVISDSVLLLQYLSNLLSNAAKFTSSGGVVLVCQVREAGPNWLEVTLGVSDSGPGIPRDAQRHVLRAFTTGDALPQEDRIGGTKSTGIGLRLADLIAHTIAEPSLKPHQDGSVVTMPEGTLSENSLGLFGPGNKSTGLRIQSPLTAKHEHYVPNGGPGTFIYFQNAIQRAPADAIARHRANPSGELSQEIDFGAYTYELKFKGTMKVLAIDDQRTMRQMVAMIYQKIALEYPGVTIDCYTALSGEQALRMCKKHRFHIVTMDQQMSSEYCRSLMDEMTNSERPTDEIPEFVRFGPDKIMNARNRQAYFKQDKWIQDIQPGDGTLLGHEAIRKIRQQFQDENLPPVLIFNLTGNLLEADRLMFLEVGSSGMLPKPTKLEDFLNLMRKNMGLYINQGLFQLSESKVVMDAGTETELQIGTRFLREVDEVDAVTVERQKISGPWAGGATQRSAGAPQQTELSSNV